MWLMPCQGVASANVPSRSTPIQPCWLEGRVEGTRSAGTGSAGAWLKSGAGVFGAKRERSHANMGQEWVRAGAGARVEVGAVPRAALVQIGLRPVPQ